MLTASGIVGLNVNTSYYEVNDLAVLVNAGRAVVEGRNPYQVGEAVAQVHFGGRDAPLVNVNPPSSLLLLTALAALDPAGARPVWAGMSLSLYLIGLMGLLWAYPARRSAVTIAWTLGLAGLWDTLHLGQIYVPLLAATIGAWLLLQRGHYALSGIPIGVLAAMKPNLLVWPILLGLSGYRVAALVAGVEFLVLTAIPVVIFDYRIYSQWFELIGLGSRGFEVPVNGSLPAVMARLGWEGGPWAAAVLLAALAALALRRRPDALQTSGLGLLGGLLASPIATAGYTMLLLPVFFHLGWSRLVLAAGALLLVPAFVIWSMGGQSGLHASIFGSVYFWAMALLLIALLRRTLRRPEEAHTLPAERS